MTYVRDKQRVGVMAGQRGRPPVHRIACIAAIETLQEDGEPLTCCLIHGLTGAKQAPMTYAAMRALAAEGGLTCKPLRGAPHITEWFISDPVAWQQTVTTYNTIAARIPNE